MSATHKGRPRKYNTVDEIKEAQRRNSLKSYYKRKAKRLQSNDGNTTVFRFLKQNDVWNRVEDNKNINNGIRKICLNMIADTDYDEIKIIINTNGNIEMCCFKNEEIMEFKKVV